MADLLQDRPISYQEGQDRRSEYRSEYGSEYRREYESELGLGDAQQFPEAQELDPKAKRHSQIKEKRDQQYVPAYAVPLEEKRPDEKLPEEVLVDGVGKIWTRRAEATWLELFYDLFFVANLLTFTDSHKINDHASLRSYIGFFALLWFTWLQAALFDLRFGKDSLIQRICKGLQIGVMVGFAAANTRFDPRYPERNWDAFRTLSLLLMGSRLTIAIQYLVVWLTVRRYSKTTIPLVAMAGMMFISAIIFLGVAFSFRPDKAIQGYIGWYVLLAFEAVFAFAVSFFWKIVSFKHTHLISRMGLLTLIVMGEGIIGLLRATSLATEGLSGWTPTMAGQAVSGVLCIYFIYMLYFDDEPNFVYSTVPQQAWAILHFPFHLGIVLFVEGQQQLMVWQNIIMSLNDLSGRLEQAYLDGGTNNGPLIAQKVSEVIVRFFPPYRAEIIANQPEFQFWMNPLRDSGDPNVIHDQIDKLWDLSAYAIFNGYGIESPPRNDQFFNTDNKFDGFSEIYELVAVYFFASAGGFFAVLAIFTLMMKWPKDKFEWVHISLRAIAAVALGLSALVGTNVEMMEDWITSPWIVPAMALILLLVILIDKVIILCARRWSKKKVEKYNWAWVHGKTGSDERLAKGLGSSSTSVTSLTGRSGSGRSKSRSGSSTSASSYSGSAGGGSSGSGSSGGGGYNHGRNRSGSRSSSGYSSSRHSGSDYTHSDPDGRSVHSASNVKSHSTSHQTSHYSGGGGRHRHGVGYVPSQLAQVEEIDEDEERGDFRYSGLATDPSRRYEEFLTPVSPRVPFYGLDRYPDGEKSRETVIRRHSSDSLAALIPKPLNVTRSRSPSVVSNIDKISTDMPQTNRGFNAQPVGFQEGEEGRVDAALGERHLRETTRDPGRRGALNADGRFMRSTESMLGIRQVQSGL